VACGSTSRCSPVQAIEVVGLHDDTRFHARPRCPAYLIAQRQLFPNWRCDARNIVTVFYNRTSSAPESGGDVFSGAWAYPESSSCCGRSLWYSPLLVGSILGQYAFVSGDPWMREMAVRQLILQTYDAHETGVTEDNIDGGIIVNGAWFNIAHPLPLYWVQMASGWLPEELGAGRENHIVRSCAVVKSVCYGDGDITYSTFDAPPETVDVLRLAFVPQEITADERALRERQDLSANGYTVKKLSNGDAIVHVRHDGATRIRVRGEDPQRVLDGSALTFDGAWTTHEKTEASGRTLRTTEAEGAAVTQTITVGPGATRVRFMLETVLHCSVMEDHVTYYGCDFRLARPTTTQSRSAMTSPAVSATRTVLDDLDAPAEAVVKDSDMEYSFVLIHRPGDMNELPEKLRKLPCPTLALPRGISPRLPFRRWRDSPRWRHGLVSPKRHRKQRHRGQPYLRLGRGRDRRGLRQRGLRLSGGSAASGDE